MKSTVFVLVMLFSLISFAQEMNKDSSYYAEIPTAPLDYTPGAMISRMVDGLGFRYYWATEGLTEADLRYKPSADARTLEQTLDHIYGLSRTILNSAKLEPTDFTKEQPKMNPLEMRFATLENFRLASALFLTSDDISKHSIVFIRKNGRSEFPFWNQINGPIEDAVWHAGQVVVLRRASGNPIYPKVNVFLGKLND
ncbi:MAG: putative damage-inducible protein DinB [Maribacter sp.]|jgi:uncharacterized damage-inducible protein DinB